MITSTKSSASSINGVCGVNAAAVLTSTSPSPSSSGSELSPRNGGVGKPVRRRSRASKKTPTTHLNADAASFRAVVQQFTGCHTAATFSGAHKGPINLNFGVQEDDDVVFDAVFEMRYGGNESGFRGDRCRKERSLPPLMASVVVNAFAACYWTSTSLALASLPGSELKPKNGRRRKPVRRRFPEPRRKLRPLILTPTRRRLPEAVASFATVHRLPHCGHVLGRIRAPS
nr:VQ motif-containing protein 22 [Ipomoea batatas]